MHLEHRQIVLDKLSTPLFAPRLSKNWQDLNDDELIVEFRRIEDILFESGQLFPAPTRNANDKSEFERQIK